MSFALFIAVKESIQELRLALKKSSLMMQPRIKMLIAMKNAGESGISKRELMDTIGASSQSIHNWRTAYKQGGMAALLHNGRKGKAGKPSVFSEAEHKKLEQKLKDPKNGLAGYVELQQWIEKEFGKEVKYNTVLKYAMRHFGSSVKVARKSHVKKDEGAVTTFKKTSLKK
jgi:transposase